MHIKNIPFNKSQGVCHGAASTEERLLKIEKGK